MKLLLSLLALLAVVVSLVMSSLAFQDPLEVRVGRVETHDAVQDTQIARLGILYFTPTEDTFFTPDATQTVWRATDNAELQTLVATFTVTETPQHATATPATCWQSARVTAEPRLNVRNSPGGSVVDTLVTNTIIRYDPSSATSAIGFIFVKLDTTGLPNTPPEWVAREFLANIGECQK